MSEELEDLDPQNQEAEKTEQNQNAQSQEDKNENNEEDKITLSKKDYESLLGQKEYYQTQYKKTKTSEKKVNVENKSNNLEDRLAIIEFSTTHKDLDREDIEMVLKLSKADNIKLEDALNLPIVQNNLKYKSEEKKKQNANISSSRSPKYVVNNVEFKTGMSREDHVKAWEEAQQQ